MPTPRHLALTVAMTLAAQGLSAPAMAQAQAAPVSLESVRREIETLRAEQARTAERIAALEAAVQGLAPHAVGASAQALVTPEPVAADRLPSSVTAMPRRLQVSGDVRVRYEDNFGDMDARDRGRGVLRARLRSTYAVNGWLSVGGQIATGDPDDPNSTDITLSNFDDDLQVSLDQVYVRAAAGDFTVYVGKIPQPFVRTDLLWDGDVSLQGVSAAWKTPLIGGASLRATGLYFLVDESVAGPDSRMVGGQLAFETASTARWKLELATGYYDYSLRSLAGGDAGDFRTNRFAAGRYASDFNLFNVVGAVTYIGLGEAWPIRLVGDYVRNSGATRGLEEAVGTELTVGRVARPGDWRWGYGYAQAETDAVLAAFANDNTNLGSNYLQHALSLDYMITKDVVLNTTLYHYRPKDAADAGANAPHDWLERVRLNLLVNF